MPQNSTDGKSTPVHVMAWCHQAKKPLPQLMLTHILVVLSVYDKYVWLMCAWLVFVWLVWVWLLRMLSVCIISMRIKGTAHLKQHSY